MYRLKNQTAIVTGGAMGIGNSIARKFAEEGADILIADIKEKESKEAVDLLRDTGADADYCLCDVTNIDDIYKMTGYCEEKFGKIDILINNAGIQISRPSMKFNAEDFDLLMKHKFQRRFLLCTGCRPHHEKTRRRQDNKYFFGKQPYDECWQSSVLHV